MNDCVSLDKRPIRVLLWAPYGSGRHYSGPGSFAYRLYKSAQPGRFEITLVHGFTGQEKDELFASQHLLMPLNHGPVSLWRFLKAARNYLISEAGKYDVFHGLTGFHCTVAPAYCAQKLGLPAVVFVANHRVDLAEKTGLKRLLGLARKRQIMLREIGAVVALSHAIEHEMFEYGIPPSKVVRIPMGVDIARFRPATEIERLDLRRQFGWHNCPTLLFVGEVVERKQPHLLLEAMLLARHRGFHFQIVIAGPENDTAYSARIRRLAHTHGVEDRLIWFGFTDDIAPVYRAADFFALPSTNEGMAASIVEAMASGLPSIVTPVSGMKDVIDDGMNGRIVPGDVESISNVVVEYLCNEEMRKEHGAAARKRVVEKYSTEIVIKAYEQLFIKLRSYY